MSSALAEPKQAVAVGAGGGPSHHDAGDFGGGGMSDEDALQARLDALRKG